MRRRRILWAVNLALGLAALAWVLRQFGRGALDVLSTRPAIGPLVAFVVAVLAAILLSALRWRVILGAFPNALGLGRLFAFRAASQSLASILPGGRVGGEPLRVWYAMQAGVPTPIAVTSVVVDRTLEIATGLPFVVAFALVLAARNVPGIEQAVIAAVVGMASLGVATAAGIRRLRRGGLLAPFVESLCHVAARARATRRRRRAGRRRGSPFARRAASPRGRARGRRRGRSPDARAVRLPPRGVRAAARTDRDRRGRVRVGRGAHAPRSRGGRHRRGSASVDLRRPRAPAGGGPCGRHRNAAPRPSVGGAGPHLLPRASAPAAGGRRHAGGASGRGSSA